jgi:TolA-binding protein
MKTILQSLAILSLFALVLLFNIGLMDIRIGEVSYLLGKAAQSDEFSQTLGIAAKYELIKQRLTSGEESVSNYELEARIQAITSGEMVQKEKQSAFKTVYTAPIRGTVNAIRFLMGKPLISPQEENKVFSILEIGYFWERNRKYNEAIQIYDSVLAKGGVPPEVKAAVLLHKAFSHSMLSQYETAKKLYETVIDVYPNTDAGVLAWKLIDFINSIQREQKRVETAGAGDLEKAKQFYLLMDYRNAIKFLSMYLEQHPKEPTVPEARFYKGRAHEELGETEEAMNEYYTVIRDDTSKRWAKQANRRLLMLGEFYESKKQVAQEARKRLDAYKDNMFGDKVQQYASLVSETSLRSEMMAQAGGAKSVAHDSQTDSLLNFINGIGNLDLSGEKAKVQQEQIRKLSTELIASGQLSREQVRELERKNQLAANALRRPAAIKAVIDENITELQYLYNKRLRTSSKLSGSMLVRLQIRADGSVGSAGVVQTNIDDEGFKQDVIGRISHWSFKAIPDSLGDLTVNYPFEFNKDE